MRSKKGQERNSEGANEKSIFSRVCRGLSVAILLTGVMFAVTAGTAAAQSAPDCSTVGYNGDGTTSNPYEVENVSQLQCVGNSSTTTTLADNFTQVSDIDASGTSAWNGGTGFAPIGNSSNPFTGNFDGAEYAITGLTVNRTSEDFVGLFGLTDGSVANVTLLGADVRGDDFVGILAGQNSGTVELSSADGTVAAEQSSCGGATPCAGGVGGLIGKNTGTSATVTESYATASVSGKREVGGLSGRNADNAEIADSYATGNVTGSEDVVGGLVGANTNGAGGTIKRSYAVGAVTGSGPNIGGLTGFGGGSVQDSYWDINTTGQASTGNGATGLTTDQMTGDAAETNMTGFAFGTTWVTTDTYPQLRWSIEQLALDAPGTLTIRETASTPSTFEIVDGRTPSVTGVANYSSSDTTVITVSSPLQAVGVGTATVTAEHFGFTGSQAVMVGTIDCADRRSLSRGQENKECPTDREISRGESRDELDRNTGRNSDTQRRDRSRGEGRSRGR